MRHILLAVMLFLAWLSVIAEAHAQQQMPSYQPSRPTLSPYLYLTRPQAGPFPNYQTFVQPYKNQQQANLVQQSQITNLQQGQEQQSQQLQQLQFAPAPVSPTGIGSSFNSLSHYYPTASAAVPRGGAQRGRAPARR